MVLSLKSGIHDGNIYSGDDILEMETRNRRSQENKRIRERCEVLLSLFLLRLIYVHK